MSQIYKAEDKKRPITAGQARLMTARCLQTTVGRNRVRTVSMSRLSELLRETKGVTANQTSSSQNIV